MTVELQMVVQIALEAAAALLVGCCVWSVRDLF
jgi:hypothetical protein